MTGEEVIRLLDLKPHPEGGFFRETFRDLSASRGRAAATAIYFLLRAGEISRWHRIDAAEIWHFYAGEPFELTILEQDEPHKRILGSRVSEGQQPQIVVPAHCWQTARSLGAYTLVGCTVAPGFEFSGFELAPENFEPG